MYGIVIEYELSGDEAAWRQAVDTFLKNIDGDPVLQGKFSYEVNSSNDSGGRIHIGHWDREETLAHLQSQPFFKEFAGALQGFAGGSLKATKIGRVAMTGSG